MAGEWPPAGWPPPIDPALMGGPVPYPQPMPELPWPPPEYATMMDPSLPPPPVDPVMAANEQLLAQPVAPPMPEGPWPPPEWAPTPPPTAPVAQAAPQPQARPQGPQTPGQQIQQAGGIKEDSVLREGELRGEQADIRAQGARQAADTAALYDMQNERRAMERQADLDQRWQGLEKERQELATAKINPSQFYDDMETHDRLAWAGMAFVAGALGVRNGSGRNAVLEQVNRMVDANIDAQKANLANRRTNLNDGQSLYQQLVEKHGDADKAAAILKAGALDRVAMDYEAKAMEFDNPVTKEKYLQAAADIRVQNSAGMQAQAMKEQEHALNVRQVNISAKNAETSRRAQEAEANARKDAQDAALAKMSKEEQAKLARGPDGAPIVDPRSGAPLRIEDDAERKEASRKMRAYGNYRTALADYMNDAEKVGVVRQGWAQSEDASRLQAKRANLFNAWRGMVGAGTIDQGSIDAFSKIVPEPNGWITGYDPVAGVRTTLELTDKAMDSDMRYYGYSGNWSSDYNAEVPFDKGSTQAKGSRQHMKYQKLEDDVQFKPYAPPRQPGADPFAPDPYGGE